MYMLNCFELWTPASFRLSLWTIRQGKIWIPSQLIPGAEYN